MSETDHIRHLFTHYRSLGGVQSVLRGHYDKDPQLGFSSHFFSYFESESMDKDARIHALGLGGRHAIRHLRQRLALHPGNTDGGIAVYLNFWGLPVLCDLDRCHRRIGVLHSDWPGVDPWISAQEGLVDGVICISPALVQACRARLPNLEADRIVALPCPIQSPPEGKLRSKSFRENGRLHIGFCGRIGREQKRADRLPGFTRILDQLGVAYQLDIVGDGPLKDSLDRQFRSHPHVEIVGRLSGTAYWERIRQWDVLVFLSEFEGIPLVLLEALSMEVLPVYPDIGGGGGDYVRSISDELLYPMGNLEAAAQRLKTLSLKQDSDLASMRSRGWAAIQPHVDQDYFPRFAEFTRFILNAPRISASKFRSRPVFWSDYLPFGVLRRFYIHALLRRTPPKRLAVQRHPDDQ